MDIDYKIQKYTHKLRNASSQSRAKVYQQKLQGYHRLNQRKMVGGDDGEKKTPDQLISAINDNLRALKTKSEEECKRVNAESKLNFDEQIKKYTDSLENNTKVQPITPPNLGDTSKLIAEIQGCQATEPFTESLEQFNNFVTGLIENIGAAQPTTGTN